MVVRTCVVQVSKSTYDNLDAERERGNKQKANRLQRHNWRKNRMSSRRKRPREEKEKTEQYAQHKVQAVRLQRLIKTVDDWQEKGEATQFVN